MSEETGAPEGRGRRAARNAVLGLAAGAVLGLLDALRSRLDPTAVLPPSLSPLVVLLYAGVAVLPAYLCGFALPPAAAPATVLCGAVALGLGLVANAWWLPAFTDPISLAADGAILVAALVAARALARKFAACGLPATRFAAAVAAGALAASILLMVGGGRGDGPAPSARRTGPGEPMDVLLVVIDTLRADAATTPTLEALGAEGTVFTRCRAPSSWTKPSTASLLTGLQPAEHGALDFESVLPGGAVTLAEVLRAAGWRTAAFADNPFVSPEYGFAQGFDAFTGRHPSPLARGTLLLRALSQVRLRVAGGAAYSFGPGVDLGADRILGDAVAFLGAGGGKPSFAYAHVIEPHYPYTPPPPYDGGRPRVDPPHSSGILPFDSFPALRPGAVATMRANYFGEVQAADAALGRALDALRKAGRLDRTLVLVTSDHGEEFHEHGGWTHGQSLYEELVRVPLVIRAPKGGPGAGRRVDAPVSLVDLLPTILDLAGVASSAKPSGRSLAPLLRGEKATPEPCFAEIESGPVGARAVFLGNRALIESRKSGQVILQDFDLAADPGQARALAPEAPGRAEMEAELRRGFERMGERALGRESRPMDEETKRALEGIGYTGK